MICVTGAEARLDALAARIEAEPELLHEIRADRLERIDDALFELCARHAERVLFCCRARADLGDADRVAVLHRAHDRGARYVDVEDDVPLEGFALDRVVLSHHDFDGCTGLVERATALGSRNTAVVKLAARVGDVADLALFREARSRIGRQAVLVGMGPAGLLSRARPRAFGSAWTYAAASPELTTAPGQLTLAELRELGDLDAPFCGLVGGPQVLGSPGRRVYNALFRARGLRLGYLPLVTASLERALPLLAAAGARGLSVTMPHKAAALGLSEPDALASEVGSVNSLRAAAGGWEGTNSDVAGVAEPLRAAGARGRVLVLGAGGAARAAVRACRDLGLPAVVCARSPRGLDAHPWDARTTLPHDILINATPLPSPWPADQPLAPLVFDLALGQDELVSRARREGSRAIDALEMWVHQGARQMTWILGEPVGVDELRREL